MQPEIFKQQWDQNGYLIVPQLLDSVEVEELREICDRIFQLWVKASPNPEQAANSTNMAFLTEPDYFIEHPEQLTTLLNVITHPQIFKILSQINHHNLLFHNTQYFFNPLNQTRCGDWHRDQQFGALNEEIEKARMASTIGIHVHIAFLPDNNLEYVPGSHKRWDTSEELEIRKGLNGKPKNASDMPNAKRIDLNSGDAVFFDAWGIHRGNYIANIPRQTFDIIYGTQPDWYTPPPTCFLTPNVLNGLTEDAQRFFIRFIETYQDKWVKGEYSA